MRKFDDAWRICKTIDEESAWKELGTAAISELDIIFGKELLQFESKNPQETEVLLIFLLLMQQ